MSAAIFFAVDGLIPKAADDQIADHGANIVLSSLYADRTNYLSEDTKWFEQAN